MGAACPSQCPPRCSSGGGGQWRRRAAAPKTAAVGIAAAAGTLLVAQSGINISLRKHCLGGSPFFAACASFVVSWWIAGALVLVEICAGVRCECASIRRAPWYAYMGGFLGAMYIIPAILLTESLGFATFQLCATLGQLLCGVLCDAVGLLRLPRRLPTRARLCALCALAAATVLTLDKLEARGAWYALLGSCLIAAVAGSIFPVQARG